MPSRVSSSSAGVTVYVDFMTRIARNAAKEIGKRSITTEPKGKQKPKEIKIDCIDHISKAEFLPHLQIPTGAVTTDKGKKYRATVRPWHVCAVYKETETAVIGIDYDAASLSLHDFARRVFSAVVESACISYDKRRLAYRNSLPMMEHLCAAFNMEWTEVAGTKKHPRFKRPNDTATKTLVTRLLRGIRKGDWKSAQKIAPVRGALEPGKDAERGGKNITLWFVDPFQTGCEEHQKSYAEKGENGLVKFRHAKKECPCSEHIRTHASTKAPKITKAQRDEILKGEREMVAKTLDAISRYIQQAKKCKAGSRKQQELYAKAQKLAAQK